MGPKILLVEDELGLVRTLTDRLRGEGYVVETVGDGMEALERASSALFDFILLDIMLPGKNGFDVCRDLRQRGISVPILMLTARSETVDKIVGLKLGADDYLTKPFEMLELLARVEALLRRPRSTAPSLQTVYQFGAIRVDVSRAEVRCRGQVVPLSAREFQLLRYFVEHPGGVISRETLLQEVWGYEARTLTRTLDVHVAWLRQKVEENPAAPRLIVTVRGMGYKFEG